MTDAEIRGGLDGLIIGKRAKEWSDQVSGLRLSQLLDMYYSQVHMTHFLTFLANC